MASFGDVSAAEMNDLARMLRLTLAKLYHGPADPDFNFTIRSAPAESVGVKYFHWYLSVIPRLTRVAGLELGSGMFINTVPPEAAAELLRKVHVETVKNTAAAATSWRLWIPLSISRRDAACRVSCRRLRRGRPRLYRPEESSSFSLVPTLAGTNTH